MADLAGRLWENDSDTGRSRSQRGGDLEFDGFGGFSELPGPIKTDMRKIASSLKAKISHLSKVQKRVSKLMSEENELNKGNTPAGHKPFTLPFSAAETEQPVADTPLKFELEIPAGASYSDAKKQIHFFALKVNKDLDIKLAKLQEKSIKQQCGYKEFEIECKACIPTVANFDSFGLELPIDLCGRNFDTVNFAKDQYVKILHEVKKEEAKIEQDIEKEKKEKAKVVEDASKLNPKEILQNMVKQTIDEFRPKGKGKGKSKGKGKDAKFEIDYVAAALEKEVTEDMIIEKPAEGKRKWTKAQLALRKVREQPKNGSPPQAAGGQSTKGQSKGKVENPKGKGQGKGKAASKGKGKGAWNGQKGKGKGGKKNKGQGRW